ncbi:type IV pilus biogenesis protein PilF [Psychrobacter sp. JCM 18900]|nr:type IV pilus biogenesis protein PilF [Psychrobacter sp. JCM 18900]
MMAAMMTSKNSCQFKYQKSFSKFYQQSSISAAQTTLPKRAVLSAVLGILVLSGCQTTPTNDLLGNSPYQTSTRASNDRNLDQQEIARVRTSLAAQYIRKK